jgi:hypothetical protein
MKISLREILLWVFVSAVSIHSAVTQYRLSMIEPQLIELEQASKDKAAMGKVLDVFIERIDRLEKSR